MEVVVMPQLSGGAGGGTPSILRYRIAGKGVVDGTVALADRTVNVVALAEETSVRVLLPPRAEGAARDLVARLEVTGESVPEISFVGSEGEEIVIESDGVSDLACQRGTNVYAFTETAAGRFFVVRKSVYPAGEEG